jgi:hypothetical protein
MTALQFALLESYRQWYFQQIAQASIMFAFIAPLIGALVVVLASIRYVKKRGL